jgi:titin
LTNGDRYSFVVKAVSAAGTGLDSPEAAEDVVPATVPDTPGSVTATAGKLSAAVSFSAPGGNGAAVNSYTVTAQDVTDPQAGGQTASGSDTQLTVLGLIASHSYKFRVVATNAIGDSSASSASNEVQPTGVPAVVPDVTVTEGDQSARVEFGQPADNGSAITGYTVVAEDLTDATRGGQRIDGTSRDVTFNNLANGDRYTFKVSATNALGTGAQSAASAAVTPYGVPGAPSNLIVTADGADAVTINFTAADANGSQVTGYTATAKDLTNSGNGGQQATVTGTASTVRLSGLTQGDSYSFTIRAANARGEGAVSVESTAVSTATAPDTPAKPTITMRDRTAEVVFTAPAANGSAITSYTVVATDGTGIDAPQTVTGSGSPIRVSGLSYWHAYTFKVSATNAIGTSSASGDTDYAYPLGKPGAATSVTASVSPVGSSVARVSFSQPEIDGGSTITSYEVTAHDLTDSARGGQKVIVGRYATVADFSDLVVGDDYSFSVVALNAIGAGPISDESQTLNLADKPDAPAKPTVTVGAGAAVVSFDAAQSNGAPITSYTVRACGSNNIVATPATPGSVRVTGLRNGDYYNWQVAATNRSGRGQWSQCSTLVTPVDAPATPTGVTATAGLDPYNIQKVVRINFGEVAANGSSIVAYEVTAHDLTTPANGGQTVILDSSRNDLATGESGATFAGLIEGDDYKFSVTAINRVGASAASDLSNTVNLGAAPDAPARPAVAAGKRSAVVYFDEPVAHGSAIESYTVTAWGQGGPFVATGTSSPITVTGLVAGEDYSFDVTATNG